MHSKLAGHLPLQDLIQSTLMSARTKLAAAEEADKKKAPPFAKKEEKKDEKKEESKEKMSSVINPYDPDEIEKLASALDAIGDDFIKEADSVENGGESKQGGEQIPTNSPVGGTQPYKRDGSKKHQIPTSTGLEKKVETGPAATAVPDTQHSPPVPLNSAYPSKGVLKTAAEAVKEMVEKKKADKEEKKEESKEKKSGAERLQAAIEKVAEESYGGRKNISHSFNLSGASEHANEEKGRQKGRQVGAITGAALGGLTGGGGALATTTKNVANALKRHPEDAAQLAGHVVSKLHGTAKGRAARALLASSAALGGAAAGGLMGRPVGGSVGRTVGVMKGPPKEKSSAVDYVLGKIAESSQGGMTLDSPSGVGPKPESGSAGGNDARKALESSQAAINMKKVDGKKPQKRMLSEVLSEPALTKSTDSKVQENLRNAAAGGVKIAAAREYLAKIAADESNPKHEELKKALAKKKEEKSEEKKES